MSNSDAIRLIEDLATECHSCAKEKGWYIQKRNNAELIALIHSELSECLEALRSGDKPDDHIVDMNSGVIELADAVIRIFDMAKFNGWSIGKAIIKKMQYNRTREIRHGGKLF